MTVLATYTKQPGETMDYDILYSDWFSTRSDTGLSATATIDAGITLVSTTWNETTRIVKLIVSGGVADETYKATVRLTTSSGIIKEDEIKIKVKES